VPGVGLTPVDKPDKDDVSRALSVARTSTASLGKFDATLPKEKPEKRRGKKRKVRARLDTSGSLLWACVLWNLLLIQCVCIQNI